MQKDYKMIMNAWWVYTSEDRDLVFVHQGMRSRRIWAPSPFSPTFTLTRQDQLYNLQSPVQKENVGIVVKNVLRISAWWQ